MLPDLIISWPRSCDYPLWRQFLRENRDRFSKVIIVFTETYYGEDYREFIRHSMLEDNCTFMDPVPVRGDQDWRNMAVNAGLLYSTNEWVWFTEQDFLPTTKQFWIDVDNLSKGYDVFGLYQGDRLHPCCLFMKRETLARTCMNFGVIPDVSDHFSRIQNDLQDQNIAIGKINPGYCHHMNGLSQNYSMVFNGVEPNLNLTEFKYYLKECLSVSVPLDSRWVLMFRSILRDDIV